jgi:hypothetical protein
MNDDATANDDIPEIPDFDPKFLRRASRRGVARVAIITALIVIALGAAVEYAPGRIARARVDVHHMREVVARASELARPGQSTVAGSYFGAGREAVSRFGTIDVDVPLGGTDPAGFALPAGRVTVHQTLFGDPAVHFTEKFPNAAFGRLLYAPGPTKESTRRLLAGLPTSTVTTVVVELETPVPDGALVDLGSRLGLTKRFRGDETFEATALLNTPDDIGSLARRPLKLRLGWKFDIDRAQVGPAVQVREWVGGLHHSDNALVEQIVGDSVAHLKDLAATAQTYGLIVSGASPATVLKMLDRPEVRSVAVADVVFSRSQLSV